MSNSHKKELDISLTKNLKLFHPDYKEERKRILDYRKFGKYILWKNKKPVFKGGFGNDKIPVRSQDEINRVLKQENYIRMRYIFHLYKCHQKEVRSQIYNDFTIPKHQKLSFSLLSKTFKKRNTSLIKNKSASNIDNKMKTVKSTFYSTCYHSSKSEFAVPKLFIDEKEITERDLKSPIEQKNKYNKNCMFWKLKEKFRFYTQRDKTKEDYYLYKMFKPKDVRLSRTNSQKSNKLKRKINNSNLIINNHD